MHDNLEETVVHVIQKGAETRVKHGACFSLDMELKGLRFAARCQWIVRVRMKFATCLSQTKTAAPHLYN